MIHVLINTFLIISSIGFYFIGSSYNESNQQLTSKLYYLQNGGKDQLSDIQYFGNIPLQETNKKLLDKENIPLKPIPSIIKKAINQTTIVAQAYDISVSIRTATSNTNKILPIEENTPEFGVSALSINITFRSESILDLFDATASLLENMPEMKVESLEFSQNTISLKSKLIGLKK